MEFAALVFSVEASRRDSRSALPDAEVQPYPSRGERAWALVRRAFSRAPARAPSPAAAPARCHRPTVTSGRRR